MKTFCVTFGQNHPLKDNWIEVKALNYEEARKLAVDVLGNHFAFIRPKDEFDIECFPGGKVGLTLGW
jgi:hypothetical protein